MSGTSVILLYVAIFGGCNHLYRLSHSENLGGDEVHEGPETSTANGWLMMFDMKAYVDKLIFTEVLGQKEILK